MVRYGAVMWWGCWVGHGGGARGLRPLSQTHACAAPTFVTPRPTWTVASSAVLLAHPMPTTSMHPCYPFQHGTIHSAPKHGTPLHRSVSEGKNAARSIITSRCRITDHYPRLSAPLMHQEPAGDLGSTPSSGVTAFDFTSWSARAMSKKTTATRCAGGAGSGER